MELTGGSLVAAFLTFAILSFLYKDNKLYKFAEHLFVGVSAGYYAVRYWANAIEPNLLNPLIREHRWELLIPGLLGLLMFSRFVPKYQWLSRWAIAFYVGVGSGAAIPAMMQSRVLLQIEGASRSLVADTAGNPFSVADVLLSIAAIMGCAVLLYLVYLLGKSGMKLAPALGAVALILVVLLGVGVVESVHVVFIATLCSLLYFFFSREHTGVLGGAARVGIWFLMIGFGASFGYTVMARVSLLIGRVQFLKELFQEIARRLL
jgi:hypothetical protein